MVTFTTTGQITSKHGVKVCVYGSAGVGKTALFATAPAPFVISTKKESGLLSLKRSNIVRMHGENTPGINYDIPVAEIENCDDLVSVLQPFVDKVPWTLPYKTVGLDTISAIAEVELAYQMTLTTNGQRAYGEMADRIKQTLEWIVGALPDTNVVFTAKKGFSKANGLFGPAFPGQVLGGEFPYVFDILLQLATSVPVNGIANRYLITQPDYQNDAKDRSGALDKAGEQPYLYNIFQKISAA